ncbi:hypothetical protein BGZ68_003329, partial [Mortierella alpina]
MEVEDSSDNTEGDTVMPLVDESVVLGIESEAATPDIVDEPRAFTGVGADPVLSAAADEVVAPAVTESDGDMSVVESDNDTSSGTEVEGSEVMAVDLVDDPVTTEVIDAEVSAAVGEFVAPAVIDSEAELPVELDGVGAPLVGGGGTAVGTNGDASSIEVVDDIRTSAGDEGDAELSVYVGEIDTPT